MSHLLRQSFPQGVALSNEIHKLHKWSFSTESAPGFLKAEKCIRYMSFTKRPINLLSFYAIKGKLNTKELKFSTGDISSLQIFFANGDENMYILMKGQLLH